jgi:hypothetical protein
VRRGAPLLALALLLAAGCAAGRHRVAGEEASFAVSFFAGASPVAFPVSATFGGTAELSGSFVPVVAGINAPSPGDETVGVYDPLGRPLLFLKNREGTLSVSRGEVAVGWLRGDLPSLQAGPVSLARILSGAPGYPVTGGEVRKGKDGEWIFSDGVQTLFSDPLRRFIARAEYMMAGRRVVVTYPGRNADAPPPAVMLEAMGGKLTLRRDEE